MNDINYVKNDKVYKVKKQAWRPRKARIWLLLPLLALIVLGGYAIFNSIGVERTGLTEYRVNGDIDYKVYLKDNDYYNEKTLGSGMLYIANLISVISVDYNYELEGDDNLNANYQYEIIATAKVTDRGDKNKVLYEQEEVLKSNDIVPVEGGKITIRDKVDIDYDRYNNYMHNFRSDFGIAANCLLDLKMVVKVDGAIKTEDTLAVSIPLSDQTVDIAIDTKAINRDEHIGEEVSSLYLENTPLLIVGSAIILISIILAIIVIYYYATRYNDNLYEKALHKILKENDTYIVNASETVYELPDVIRVDSFKELMDASQAESAPVIFLEVIPGEKSYFIVNGVNTTYRYTLSKAYQDKLAANGEKEY